MGSVAGKESGGRALSELLKWRRGVYRRKAHLGRHSSPSPHRSEMKALPRPMASQRLALSSRPLLSPLCHPLRPSEARRPGRFSLRGPPKQKIKTAPGSRCCNFTAVCFWQRRQPSRNRPQTPWARLALIREVLRDVFRVNFKKQRREEVTCCCIRDPYGNVGASLTGLNLWCMKVWTVVFRLHS